MNDLDVFYRQVAEVLVEMAGADWAVVTATAPVLGTRCGGIELSSIDPAGKKTWLKPKSKAISVIDETFLKIRDVLLENTKQRIWFIDFQFLRVGKVSVKFGYDKPSWYEEPEDLPEMKAVEMLVNPAALAGLNEMESDSLQWLQSRSADQSAEWGLGRESRWNIDVPNGKIFWHFDNGETKSASVQFLGTLKKEDGEFRWAWSNTSIPDAFQKTAQLLRHWGSEQNVPEFLEATVAINELRAWSWAAMAAQMSEAQGAYRVDADGVWLYVVFDGIQ